MNRYLRYRAILFSLVIAALVVGSWLLAAAAGQGTVSGTVVDRAGPIVGAHVRVRATDNLVFTDGGGNFVLRDLTETVPLEITAWYSGYYVASKIVTPTANDVVLTLRPHHQTDNPDYSWTSPISGTSAKACGRCHPMIIAQWQGNAHGGAIANPRFFSLYNGTDLSGTHSVGPGYRLDFPDTAGSCASCHGPGAGADGYLTTDMEIVRGEITAGIHCDYCHKVGGVYLDPSSGSVFPNVPGVEGQKLLRPPIGDDIFIGPYDDIPDPDTYLPIYLQSDYCAPCHQFSFWGTPIYESFNEWLASPYAQDGITCQECHMPPNGDLYFADPAMGGLVHDPEKIPSHLQLGASDQDLLANTAEIGLETQSAYNQLRVRVTITNSGAGHHVPTDFPGRQMILLVSARDESGGPLKLVNGPTVPEWGGIEAGMPGKVYAKVLQDIDTGGYPVVSYWKPSRIIADSRLPALAGDETSYSFSLPKGLGPVEVTVTLLLRRIVDDVARAKGWTLPDMVMEEAEISLIPLDLEAQFIPLVNGGR